MQDMKCQPQECGQAAVTSNSGLVQGAVLGEARKPMAGVEQSECAEVAWLLLEQNQGLAVRLTEVLVDVFTLNAVPPESK